MTVLIHDAKGLLNTQGQQNQRQTSLDEALYADDTMLIGTSAERLQEYMERIQQCGQAYGLSFNIAKLECLCVNCEGKIFNENGEEVPAKDHIKYLGALLSSDGHATTEISRRVGLAKAEFQCLQKCWNHCRLHVERKKELYQSLVLSKLLYGLESVVLLSHDKRRLNSFHASCCRRILRISPSYISRVSNDYVLKRLKVRPLSCMLLKRQLQFFGALARRPHNDVVRGLLLVPGTCKLIEVTDKRRGRPRATWASHVYPHACGAAGAQALQQATRDKDEWSRSVHRYCQSSVQV